MGQIKVEKNVNGIEGLCVIQPQVHGDSRGYFMETYSQRDMEEAGLDITFVQDNQSMSAKGVLRGLHYQINYPQTKLQRDLEGGMAISLGRLRPDSQYDYKFVGLSHNTLRGAAGGGVLLAELLCAEGYITRK